MSCIASSLTLSVFTSEVAVSFDTWLKVREPDWCQACKLHIFTDGTHNPDALTGAWAVVCALEQLDGAWVWLGMLSSACNWLGMSRNEPCYDASVPEVAAILRGLVVACACQVSAVIHFDCQSAADAVCGRTCNGLGVVKEAMSMLEIARCRGVAIHFVHETSHTGVALNELADGLAKLACRGISFPPIGDEVDAIINDSSLSWLWLCLAETQAHPQWPYVDSLDGTYLLNVDSSVGVDVGHVGPSGGPAEFYVSKFDQE